MRPFASDLIGVGAALGMLCASAAVSASAASRPGDHPIPGPAEAATEGGESLAFDLPAQPLADALRQYASLTRRPTLFRSGLVDGRYSSAVRGRYSSEAALHQLLDGTGLVAERSDTGPFSGFILKAARPSDIASPTSLGSLAGYPGRIQARVWDALCADVHTMPGKYRSLLRFEVDGGGQIQQPRLLGTTGDAQRDAAILPNLRGVDVGAPPPPGLSQPVTMLVVPRADGDADGPQCGDGTL